MHIETRILGRKTNQLDSTIWRALSEKRDGSLGNLSFLNLSRFLLTLFSLFFLSLLLLFFLLLLYFFIFWTTAPSSVVTTPWQSARPTRFDLVFFSFLLSSLYFVWLCKCFFNAILFFFSSLLPTSARPQCLCPYCRHYLSLSYGSVGAPPLPFALGPFTRVIRSPFHLLFFLFLFRFCTFVPPPPSRHRPHGGLAPLDLALVVPQVARHPPWWFPRWSPHFLREATRVLQPSCVIMGWVGSP